MFFHHLQDDTEKTRLLRSPEFIIVLPKLPAVDRISVQDQSLTIHGSQEIADLHNLRVSGTKVDIRHHHRPVRCSFSHFHKQNLYIPAVLLRLPSEARPPGSTGTECKGKKINYQNATPSLNPTLFNPFRP